MWLMKSLFQQSVAAVENTFVHTAETLLADNSSSFIDIVEQFERLYLQVRDLPSCHKAKVGEVILAAACKLSREECTSKREFAIKHLISIMLRLKPKKIDFHYIYTTDLKKMKFVHAVVFDRLKEMNELEKLEFCFPKQYNLGKQKFIKICPTLQNLVSFSSATATDKIVHTMCESCHLMRDIDLSHSKRVTNNCIVSLARFKNLREVGLYCTSVSAKGYAQLLLKTCSDSLFDLGSGIDLNKLLSRLEKCAPPLRTFELRRLHCLGGVTDLHLVPVFFPKIIQIDLDADESNIIPDISPLDRLKNARKASMLFNPHSVDAFTNFNSRILTSLNLDAWSPAGISSLRIEITTIMKIGLQCPNIEYLEFSYFSFLDDTSSIEFYSLLGRPFQKLKHLGWSNCSKVSCFKVILGYTFSIEFIDTDGEDMSLNDLNDAFFEYIMENNPLERLKYLMINSENRTSAYILKRLIKHCKKIAHFGNFNAFVALSDEQKQEVRSLVTERDYR